MRKDIIDSVHNPDLSIIMVVHVTPYRSRRIYLFRSCLTDARSLLLFKVKQVFPPDVGGLVHASCRHTTYSEGEECKGRESFQCLNFPCHKI